LPGTRSFEDIERTFRFFRFRPILFGMTIRHEGVAPPSASDRAAARDVLTRLREGGDLVVAGTGRRVAVPPSIAREVVTLLEAYADGRPVIVAAADEEISTHEVALILNLSRPTVVKLLDQGRIPFRKPGKHRRVRMSDLIAFKGRLEQDRAAALDKLTSLTQDALESARDQGRLTEEMI
jgi:excisionase family DNA binding protein